MSRIQHGEGERDRKVIADISRDLQREGINKSDADRRARESMLRVDRRLREQGKR